MKSGKMATEISTTDWKNSNPCYKATKQLAKLLPIITWKTESVPNQLWVLAKEISKQNVESISGCAWLCMS